MFPISLRPKVRL
jgi:hypothetical protein